MTLSASDQRAKAERLRQLHRAPPVLVLPNAWDVASALVFARHPRCRAIATSSAGVAAVLGYPDGERISRAEMLDLVGRVARAVDLPVTADLEAGYGPSPEAATETAEGAIAAGAVGLNLEDTDTAGPEPLLSAETHAARVRAVRETGERLGVPLVINARADVYINQVGAPDGRFDETVDRARAYLEAGADSIFVPAVVDGATIGRLAHAIDGPLNVLAGPGTPPVAELERLGVARLSVGSGTHRAVLTLAAHMAQELLEAGTYSFLADALPYAETQHLLGEET